MKTEQIIIFGLAIAVGYLLYLIIVPFLTAILWGVTLTILFYPFYNWIREQFRLKEIIASLLACTAITIFLTVPFLFLAIALVNEVLSVYAWVEAYLKESVTHFHNSPYFLPQYLVNILDKYVNMSNLNMRDILLRSAQEISNFIVHNLTGVVTNFTDFTLAIILILFTMYYLFKEGDVVLEELKTLLPLSNRDKEAIFKKTKDIVYATLYGGVLVSILQGGIEGLTFWILGIPSPIFWGTAMALLSFLPVVGTPLVWVPAAIYLFIKVSYIKAAILIIISVFLIVVIDSFLKPMIVSGKTHLHPLLLIFSILGGIKVVGFIGIIAGPIVLSLSLTMLEIYKAGYLTKEG
ncbi:MAG: AI-2E family transporter [Deltaproteobacteria bacterium]|nr:AI-2E family transporter [Deltaproteobacteria bacterium]